MSKKSLRWNRVLKSLGFIPKSVEYRIGDPVLVQGSGEREAVVVGVVPQGDNTFKVKVVYRDTDEVVCVEPETIIGHATSAA